ncbi:MAG: hypothetical protein RLY16_2009 [Bacteroidota bacterium]|jgi:S-adenosylmethionine:tRNA ribosyltransferase-isomerase
MHPRELSIADFTYDLPDNRIAAAPLAIRDQSKLLVYRAGKIEATSYHQISDYLPHNSLLIFNNTKVIQARILFKKDTGGIIEIFCLEPDEPEKDFQILMRKQATIKWKCLIGGASKWKQGKLSSTITTQDEAGNELTVTLEAELLTKLPDAYIVALSWQPASLSLAEILLLFGDTPLPPYIRRKTDALDKERYQTIYARYEGSVAAPTAGLHFTESIFQSFQQKGIQHDFVTLHVGAGTFKPVKAAQIGGHEMHAEWMDVNVELIERLIAQIEAPIVSVGTTSLRTLESLYWMGVKCLLNPAARLADILIHQWDVYENDLLSTQFTRVEALKGLVQWLQSQQLNNLLAPTQILIAPGYRYRVVNILATNFHQPQSTLLLLVAAAIGENWKQVYQYALENDFRFLSYGDGSLLFFDAPTSLL